MMTMSDRASMEVTRQDRHAGNDVARETPEAAMVDGALDLAASDLASAAVLDDSGDGRNGSKGKNGGLRTYPGGKNGAGVYHKLINLMPPHEVFIEAFLGSGALIRRKRPASADNVGIDVDAGVIAEHVAGGVSGYRVLHADARLWLRSHRWQERTFVYADPPYLGAARCRPRAIYRCELMGAQEHEELLQILTTAPAMVMISGYTHPLYEHFLRDWNRVEYQAQTRGGPKTEVVWMNYPEPQELHDYSFLGRDFHDRCRIARKIARWRRKLAGLPALERAAVIAGVEAEKRSGGKGMSTKNTKGTKGSKGS
jgi:DNA adenine methylase